MGHGRDHGHGNGDPVGDFVADDHAPARSGPEVRIGRFGRLALSAVREKATGDDFDFLATAINFDTGHMMAVFAPAGEQHKIYVLPTAEFERRFAGPFADGKEVPK